MKVFRINFPPKNEHKIHGWSLSTAIMVIMIIIGSTNKNDNFMVMTERTKIKLNSAKEQNNKNKISSNQSHPDK